MTMHKDTGIIERTVPKKTHEEELIEWRIPDFTTVYETADPLTCYDSPTFIVNGVSWFLRLYPKNGLNLQFLRVYIMTSEKREYALEYNFSLKKSDGSAEQFTSGILEGKSLCNNNQDRIKISEIRQRKSELIPHDILTFICKLKYEITHCTQPIVPEKTKIFKLMSLDALSKDFKNMFNDKETCDTTLNVKDKEYKAHRSVLIARSSVFAATFKHDTLERQTGVITIPDCDPDSFEMFLNFLYSGKLEEISSRCALDLYYISDKYDAQELKAFCIEYLMQNVTEENICDVAVFSDKYEETALFSAVQDFFNKNVRKIFVTSEWECFTKEHNRLANKLLIEMSNVKFKD